MPIDLNSVTKALFQLMWNTHTKMLSYKESGAMRRDGYKVAKLQDV